MEKKEFQQNKFLIAAIVILVLAAAVIFFSVLTNQLNKALYEERKGSLEQLLNVTAHSIDENIQTQWEIAQVYENDLKTHIGSFNSVEAYLAYLNSQLSTNRDYYFLVDSVGRYYCSDGVNGKIIDMDYYLNNTKDQLEYLNTLPHFKDDITYLILRTRLEQPLTTNSVNGQIQIKYCCLMHDFTDLEEHISTLYDNNNNTIIFDTSTGTILYKKLNLGLLIDGYNVFDKYQKVTLLYGSRANDIISEIQNGKVNISLAGINGKRFYLCSSPLEVANWSLMLVVEGEYINSASRNSFIRIIIYILAILFVTAALALIFFWYFYHFKINRHNLDNERKINEVLNEAYQMKSNYLSYMSHDIRTPINGIIGMANIGCANSADQEKVEDCFNKIDLSGKHLLAIVNDVLDMSAIEAGKVVIQNERMNIVDTLNDCMDIIRGTLNDRKLVLKEKYDCPVQEVLGDAFHLKQIIINILSNAVKFTEDGGEITLSCRQLDEKDENISYQIIVSDTGIGMTEEFKAHIFEAFKTAASSKEAKYKGSGLGMAISNEYVHLMGGTIKVDSAVNKGSIFTILMPFGKVTEGTQDSKGMQLEDLKVLLVDDNEINLEITSMMLQDRVKQIQIARNGKEALDTFLASGEHEFNLILMDVMMPVMNGMESAKAIRASGREDQDILIIALTANSYKDDIDAIFESGINDYLNKPFSVDQLIEKIANAVQ